MNILFVTTHLNIGGVAYYTMMLASALKAKGLTPVVASSGGSMEGEFQRRGIKLIRVDLRTKSELKPKVFFGGFRLAKIISDEKIDIIHAHTRVAQVASALASKMTAVPYVTTCHGFFQKRLGRLLFGAWGAKVIAISEPVKMSLINDFNIQPSNIALVHTGIELDRFSKAYSSDEVASLKRRLGLKDAPVIGTIGRLSPVKGHRFFIEAVAHMVSRGYDVQGILIGDGPEEGALKSLVEKLKIKESFRFFKADPDTAKYFAVMDIFVFPSVKEGLGLSLMEAMACGRPCVAANIGGISDLIRDEKTGLLFPVGDVKRFASAIIQLLNDEPVRRFLGESAKARIFNSFSSEGMADKVIGLYNKVLESHRQI